MITKESVADLREGDVVELRWDGHPDYRVTGPVWRDAEGAHVGPGLLAHSGGQLSLWLEPVTLTVVSRAPRPLHDCPDCKHVAVPE